MTVDPETNHETAHTQNMLFKLCWEKSVEADLLQWGINQSNFKFCNVIRNTCTLRPEKPDTTKSE